MKIIKWFESCTRNRPYFRRKEYACKGIGKFVQSLEFKDDDIVGMVFTANKVEFIVEKKRNLDSPE